MEKSEFDLIKLKMCEVNVRDAIKHFNSYEEYFSALSKFVGESKYYLRDYTPQMIIGDENERKNFRADLKEIRSVLMALGVTYPMPTLAELDYEVEGGDLAAITNWLGKFHVEVDKISRKIAAARTVINEPAQKPPTNDAAEKPAAPPAKPVILAADDKPELLTAVVGMLEDKYKVMAATSGKAALRLIEKHPPALFLLDIEMPEMDGYELAETIRKQSRFETTPIIFLTSKQTREDVIAAISRGGNDYLVKPVNKELLLSKIMQHLGQA